MVETFTAQINKWVAATENRLEMVFKQSAQDVFSDAQTPRDQGGNMPVVTSFLRNSFMMWLNNSSSLKSPEAYLLTIPRAKIGDVLHGGWSAEYAAAQEFGFGTHPGYAYARKAAMRWQEFVAKNSALAKARFR